MKIHITLFHGTTAGSAQILCNDGWKPYSCKFGSYSEDPKYLYLTNTSENALSYSERKGDHVVLAVSVPIADLIVDPYNGIYRTVAEELALQSELPGSVCLFRPIAPEAFKIHEVDLSRKTPNP